ncbi:hypothetical protein DIPPA_09819 [Diplonema papillatum]|nr:hypothetical protein DIPPA_09819 [Diplonema papillatum]|eukprot:gene16650-25541_t
MLSRTQVRLYQHKWRPRNAYTFRNTQMRSGMEVSGDMNDLGYARAHMEDGYAYTLMAKLRENAYHGGKHRFYFVMAIVSSSLYLALVFKINRPELSCTLPPPFGMGGMGLFTSGGTFNWDDANMSAQASIGQSPARGVNLYYTGERTRLRHDRFDHNAVRREGELSSIENEVHELRRNLA